MAQTLLGNPTVVKFTGTVAGLAQNQTVTLGSVPAGFYLWEAKVSIGDVAASSNNLDVGIVGGDVDLIFDNLDASTGGVTASMLADTTGGAAEDGYAFTNETSIGVKNIAATATGSTGGEITLYLIGFIDYA